MSPLRCLTIGSSDSSGGAGIQGDTKTFAQLGCYGMSAVVGITVQNTRGVTGRQTVEPHLVLAQIAALREDIGFDAVKIGATWAPDTIEAIAVGLAGESCPIVVDPVLVTAAGSTLSDPAVVVRATIARLFPLAAVVTPNLREARLLTGLDQSDGRILAEALERLGAAAVVITGAAPDGRGDWFYDGQVHRQIDGPWHDTGAVHGSGCAHSAAIAAFLAAGLGLAEAANRARLIAASGVAHGFGGLGAGPGPVDIMGGIRSRMGAIHDDPQAVTA